MASKEKLGHWSEELDDEEVVGGRIKKEEVKGKMDWVGELVEEEEVVHWIEDLEEVEEKVGWVEDLEKEEVRVGWVGNLRKWWYKMR